MDIAQLMQQLLQGEFEPQIGPVEEALQKRVIDCKVEDTSMIIKTYLKEIHQDELLVALQALKLMAYGKYKEQQFESFDSNSQICGAQMGKNDLILKCKECSKRGENSSFCSDCFDESLHIGHTVSFAYLTRGMCDCGDQTALLPASFCKKHKELCTKTIENNLPDYIQQKTPIILAEMSEFIHLKFVKKSNDSGKMGKKYMKILAELVKFRFCNKMIANVLRMCFPEHTTLHQCVQYEIFNKEHQCSCSLLDLLFKMAYTIIDGKDSFRDIVFSLVRNCPDFAEAVIKSFWRNYFYLLEKFGSCGHEDGVHETMMQAMYICKNLKDCLISCLGYIQFNMKRIEILITIQPFPKEADVMISYFASDFANFFNYNGIMSLIIAQNTSFILDLFSHLVAASKTNIVVVPIAKLMDYDAKYIAEDRLIIIWGSIMTNINYYSLAFPIKSFFLKRIIENIKKCGELEHSASLGMERIFGYFLILVLFSQERTSKKQNVLIEDLINLRQEIKSLIGYSDEELDKLFFMVVYRILRCQTFIIDCKNSLFGCRNGLEDITSLYENENSKFDTGIMQILLAFAAISPSTPATNFFNIFSEATGINLFKNQLRTHEKKEGRLNLICEVLFIFCKILFNDVSVVLANLNISRTNQDTIPDKQAELCEYAIRKSSAIAITFSEEEDKPMNSSNIKIPSCLMFRETEGIIEKIIEPKSKGSIFYRLKKEALKDVNIFNSRSSLDIPIITKRLTSLIKVHSESEYNLFENLHSNSKTECINNLLADVYFKKNQKAICTIFDILFCKQEKFKADTLKICLFAILCKIYDKDIPLINRLFQESSGSIQAEGNTLLLKQPLYEHSIKSLFRQMQVEFVVSVHQGPEIKKKEIKKAEQLRNQIMAQFKKQQSGFAEKHKEDLGKIDTYSKSQDVIICSVCKEQLDPSKFDEKPYGRQILKTRNNSVYYSITQTLQEANVVTTLLDPAVYYVLRDKTFRGCSHYMHLDCFNLQIGVNDLERNMVICPACKESCQAILPVIPRISEKYANYYRYYKVKSPKPGKIMHLLLGNYFDFAFCSEIIGLSRSLLVRRDEVFDHLKLVLSANLYSPKEVIETLKKDMDLDIGKKSTLYTFLDIILFACLTQVPNPDAITELIPIVSKQIQLFILLSFLKSAIMNHIKEIKNVIIDKNRNGNSREITISYFKTKKSTEDLKKIIKQCIVIASVFAPWDVEYRKKIIQKAKDECDEAFIAFSLSELLLTPDLKNIENIKLGVMNLISTSAMFNEIENLIPIFKCKIDAMQHLMISSVPLNYKLISLPVTYEDLLMKHHKQKCPACDGKKIVKKIICLTCGRILCFGKNCCINIDSRGKNVPEVCYHSGQCGIFGGIYIEIATGSVLINLGSKTCKWGCLYENESGMAIDTFLEEKNSNITNYQLKKFALSKQRITELTRFAVESKEHQFILSNPWLKY